MSPLEAAQVPPPLVTLRVAVLVAGGIAAYKVADVVSQLVQAGAQVRVAMTASAQNFVGAATFQGLTGNPVLTDLWDQSLAPEPHVQLGDWAQLCLVAPATANVISRLAAGRGDDVVTATVLAARGPVVVAPAMNDAMWAKPAVAANIARLQALGYRTITPEEGRLASGHQGRGRLPSTQRLLDELADAVTASYDLAGRHVVVTAGGTREPIDSVRFISNYSSGKMGYAMAAAAAERGARVTLISSAHHPRHPGVQAVDVETAQQMLAAVRDHLAGADLLVMAAAVADFRPSSRAADKIQREQHEVLTLQLERNVDVLAELAGAPGGEGVFRLGFAAEQGDPVARGRLKLERKALDAILANDISLEGAGFGSDRNAGVLILRGGEVVEMPLMAKAEMAGRILDVIAPRLRQTARA